MTKREGAVLSAYTGILLCDFSYFYKYLEEILGRQVFTHEIPFLSDKIREKAEPEFKSIMENLTD